MPLHHNPKLTTMTENKIYILGIETSCDETAAAVVCSNGEGCPEQQMNRGEILSNVVLTQLDDHTPYGGVVPEIAARAHLHHIDSIIDRAIREAGIEYNNLSAIAATTGPGLIGGIMVGMQVGKALSHSLNIPFVSVNHLEAHILTPRLTANTPDNKMDYPFLSILMSGGHCQILSVNGLGDYTVLGETIDDSVGEAFDKVAKMMGLPYPGGPEIDRRAHLGDSTAFMLPRPLIQQDNCNFSFSGLKTRVRHLLSDLNRNPDGSLLESDMNNMAASFQQAVTDVFLDRTQKAIQKFKNIHPQVDKPTLVVAGGVAANSHIRAGMTDSAQNMGMTFYAPPLNLCTDNGVMIAWAGLERFNAGIRDDLNTVARPRWSLMDLSLS